MDVVFFLVYVATKRVELRRRSFASSTRKGVDCFFKFKCLRLQSDAASRAKFYPFRGNIYEKNYHIDIPKWSCHK